MHAKWCASVSITRIFSVILLLHALIWRYVGAERDGSAMDVHIAADGHFAAMLKLMDRSLARKSFFSSSSQQGGNPDKDEEHEDEDSEDEEEEGKDKDKDKKKKKKTKEKDDEEDDEEEEPKKGTKKKTASKDDEGDSDEGDHLEKGPKKDKYTEVPEGCAEAKKMKTKWYHLGKKNEQQKVSNALNKLCERYKKSYKKGHKASEKMEEYKQKYDTALAEWKTESASMDDLLKQIAEKADVITNVKKTTNGHESSFLEHFVNVFLGGGGATHSSDGNLSGA